MMFKNVTYKNNRGGIKWKIKPKYWTETLL